MPDKFEFMVKSRRTDNGREWDSPTLDEETALVLIELGQEDPNLTRTLYRRRKASPWRKTQQPTHSNDPSSGSAS